MKVYVVLETYDNGERWMDEDDGYVGWYDKYVGCYREFDDAWQYLCKLIDNERDWFEGIYDRYPDGYNEPSVIFFDSDRSAEVCLEKTCGIKQQYSVRIVEEEI